MKHSEKIFFVLSLAVLGASIFYYAKSMEQLSVEEGKNQARLQEKAKGVEWKNITVPELKIVDLEWPEIRPQDKEGKWFFQVFTPPQIWVDKDGNWYSPMFSSRPADAGKILVDRLSPAFRFPHARVAVAPTFRAMLSPEAKVTLEDSRATIEDGMNRVTLELVAVTDWNNDGVDDWLVLCRSGYIDTPRRFREYYLVIIDLKTPVLQPYVLMVLDHVYNRVTVQNDASAGELVESSAVEYMQGQAVVTQAPDSRSMKKKLEEGSSLKESSLSR